jgi:competence protein ComEC
MVIDCGTSSWRKSQSVGDRLAAPYLSSLGVDTIDVAVLTHPHADHVSGYASLLAVKPAKLVLDVGAKHASPYYFRFLRAVKKCKATYRIAKRGQSIDMGDGVIARVLSPDPVEDYADLNDNSIVLRVTYKKVALMLAADAGEEVERRILHTGARVESQVLQVGHHGSARATSPGWLAAVNPRIAVISCGRHNEYGHPSRDVLDRLNSRGTRVYRTDRNGAVMVSTDGRTVRVRGWRGVR